MWFSTTIMPLLHMHIQGMKLKYTLKCIMICQRIDLCLHRLCNTQQKRQLIIPSTFTGGFCCFIRNRSTNYRTVLFLYNHAFLRLLSGTYAQLFDRSPAWLYSIVWLLASNFIPFACKMPVFKLCSEWK